jgi:hypothetical protein
MSATPENVQISDTPVKFTVLDIPEEHIDKVAAFVEKLREEEAEVAGYGSTLTTKSTGYWTGTGCADSQTGKLGKDTGCTDTDGAR